MINWFNHCYPYTNFHELNLDWVIMTVKKGEADIKDFIGLNTIKYADPILWDITRQYEANTVVVDPTTGNAYISTKAVPYGTHINNTDYWTQIYNYADVVDTLRDQIAYNEGLSTTATRAYSVGDLVFTNNLLYRVVAPMIAGDSFVPDSNVVKTTITDEIVNINATHESLQNAIEAEATARENADTVLQNAINNIDVNHVYNQSTPDSGLTTNIGLQEGIYNITENTTINAQLVVPKGAILNISSGVTLTINGEILAGRYQIFSGAGSVVVDNSKQSIGFPEWYGAIVNDSSFDNSTAIKKCYDTFTITELSSADYYISNTLKLDKSNRTLRGVQRLDWSFNTNDNKGSRIISTSNTDTILQVGTDSQPATINAFTQNVSVENLTIFRQRSSYDWASGSINVIAKFLLRSKFEYVSSMNGGDGFVIDSCVYCHFIRCKSFTTVTNSGDTSRVIRGFRIPEETNIGVAGGSGSIYLQDCSVTVGGGIIYNASWGFQCYGSEGCADIFIEGLEVGGVNYGINIQGPNQLHEANDIHITNCVLDALGQAGILLVNFAGNGVCNIQGNYVAPKSTANSSFACYRLVNCTGAININGNQAICSPLTTAYGIKLETCAGVVSSGNMITESKNAINITGCATCEFMDSIVNRVASGALDAVLIIQSSHCKADCSINGGNNYFTNGYRFYQSAACEANVTKTITSSVTNFVNDGGTAITQTGITTNNNIVTGIML